MLDPRNIYTKRTILFKWSSLLIIIVLFLSVSAGASKTDIRLTKEEAAWLKEHATDIRYAPNPAWPPADFIDENGIQRGIVADYIKIFEQELGVTFRTVAFSSWNKILKGLQEGKADFVGAIQKTTEREAYLSFTKPFLTIPLAILVNTDSPDELSNGMIDTMSLAIVRGYAYKTYLSNTYPHARTKEFTDDLAAILQVSIGRIDGVVVDLIVASYLVEKYGISNLKVGKILDYKWELRFGATKEMPFLASILNKTLLSIDSKKRQEIYQRWVKISELSSPSFFERYQREFITLLVIVCIVLLISLFYGILLRKQVRARTMALQIELAQNERSRQEILITKEKAEEGDRLKSAFLANLSHEIRTPMNGIVGFSDLLQQEDIDSSEKSRYCQIIKRSSDQLLKIVSDILEISRLSSEKIEVDSNLVNLNKFFHNLSQIWRKESEEKGIAISFPVFDETIICVETDEIKLHQVIQNLIGNAFKFTNQGLITVDCQIRNEKLEISVKDTGIGIDPDNHEIIFDRFRQVEVEISRQYGGLGLGLPIAKAYVELLGGTIQVKSEIGRGSEFIITWPFRRISYPESSGQSFSERKPVDLTGYTILIAEDEIINQDYLKVILTKTGISIIMTSDGREAIDALEQNELVDLVLLDIKMPGLSGIDAAREICKKHPDIPLIALTAFSQPQERKAAIDAGFSRFLTKPISKEKLLQVLDSFLK